MSAIFAGCSSLTSLNLSSFNTANVTNMNSMFGICSSLTSLDLSSFNTAKVKSMYGMFYKCEFLTTTINIMNVNTSYSMTFYNAATASGSKITVNYITAHQH